MNENELHQYLAKKIVAARKAKGINRSKFARMVGFERSHLYRIEYGKAGTRIITLYKIAMALNKPVEYFLPEIITKGEVKVIQDRVSIPDDILRSIDTMHLDTLRYLIQSIERYRESKNMRVDQISNH